MRVPTLLFALCLFLLPACMQTKETVTIDENGKGTLTLDTVVDKQMTEAMVEMLRGMGMAEGMGGADPTAQLDPERIRKGLEGKEGIEVKSATRTEDPETGKITMRVVIAFDTLEALYTSGAVMGVSAKLEKLDDGNYRFTRSLFAEQLPKEGDVESQQMFEGILMMMQPYLEGMSFEAEFTMPTPILETSGQKIDEKRVRWSIGYGDLVKPSARTQTVVFSGEGLDWEAFESKAANPLARSQPDTPTGPITPTEEDGGAEEPEAKPDPKPEEKPAEAPESDGAK